MKTFSAAVTLVVLIFIYIQKSSAFPSSGVQGTEEAASDDYPAGAEEETSVETWMMPFDIRQESYNSPIRCRYCCGCCTLSVCGMCCE
ncbi:hepcidin [Lates calcarifer]|uniref:Hepcidin n=1 Tax=Lates calcarifer TaxID=8187 RepID=A0AAJ8DUQ2_LATCA|nr:hepcidin [Lates calcarifer]